MKRRGLLLIINHTTLLNKEITIQRISTINKQSTAFKCTSLVISNVMFKIKIIAILQHAYTNIILKPWDIIRGTIYTYTYLLMHSLFLIHRNAPVPFQSLQLSIMWLVKSVHNNFQEMCLCSAYLLEFVHTTACNTRKYNYHSIKSQCM